MFYDEFINIPEIKLAYENKFCELKIFYQNIFKKIKFSSANTEHLSIKLANTQTEMFFLNLFKKSKHRTLN
jgi:hypothetical protein